MVRLIPRTRFKRLLLTLFFFLLLFWVIGPRLLAPFVTAKLQKMVATQLNARVEIGTLSYMPPYGVRAKDVKLIAVDPSNPDLELLAVKQLDLKLAKLPFGSGPLVIEEIRVVEPSLHLVQTADGLAGRVKPAPAPDAPAATTVPAAKRSDMFQLRHLAIQGGQIVMEDRGRPDLPPMIWNDFSVDMSSAPTSHSAYDFQIGAAHADIANVKAKGSFDIDDLWLKVDEFRTTAQAGSRSQSAMPAQVQKVLERYNIAGQVDLSLHGQFSLISPRSSVFDGSIDVSKGRATLPGRSQSIDKLDARMTFKRVPAAEGKPEPFRLAVERLTVDASFERLNVSSADLSIDESTGEWAIDHVALALSEVSPATGPAHHTKLDGPGSIGGSASVTLSAAGTLPLPGKSHSGAEPKPLIDADKLAFEVHQQRFALWPKKYPQPVESIQGTIEKRAGTRVVTFENLSGRYGSDPVSLKSARMPLPPDIASLKAHWRIEEIVGEIDFHQPGMEYPRGMDKVLQQLKPAGRFAIGGGSWFEVNEVPIVPGEPPEKRKLSTNDPREPIENAVNDAADAITFAATSGIRPVARPRHKADYFISASSDNLTLNLKDGALPATAVSGDATFSPLSVRIERIQGQLMGGTFSGQLQVIPKDNSPFSGKVSARNLHLAQVGSAVALTPGQREKLSGTAAIDSTFEAQWGTSVSDRLNSLRASGEFEVFDGKFWSLPVLNDLLGASGNKKDDPSTVGEAAGRFAIADGVVDLQHVAVCATAVGLIGSGNVMLADKSLKLQVVAAPLGDWRDRMKQAKLPIVSDVAGEVVGAIQQVVNKATGAVLYQFEVSGTTTKPQVRAVPAPALTEGAARLFSQMLNPDQKRQWSATVRKTK